jgi:hypothetical protein
VLDETSTAEAVRRYKAGDALAWIAHDLHVHAYDIREAVRAAGALRPTSERVSIAFRTKKIRKRWCNESFFDAIDTEVKAYWLGFVTADGCVYPRHGSAPAKVMLSLSAKDKAHVERFSSDIGSNYPTSILTRKSKWGDFHNSTSEMASTQIYSDRMAESLIRLGVIPKKSTRETPSDSMFDAALRRHYWRGLIDGDGCLSFNVHKNKMGTYLAPSIQLSGSEAMCKGFSTFVREEVCENISANVRRSTPKLHEFRVSGYVVADITREMYEGATVALARKAERALMFERWIEKRAAGINPQTIQELSPNQNT